MRRHDLGLTSTTLTADVLRRQDAVLLATDHCDFPYPLIHASAPLIVDTRGAFRRRGLAGDHVVSA